MAHLRKTFALILALLAAALECRAGGGPPAGYYLVWGDEFNGTNLDTSKWIYWLTGARRDAQNTPAAVTVTNGVMTITTWTTNGTHFTGMIATDGKFRARYGYLEASIDFNDSPGMWSAYWLQSPTMGSYIGDPSTAGAEIDICEHRSTDGVNNINDKVQSNIHWDGYGADAKSTGSGNYGTGLGTGFHTYGLLWTPSSYQVSTDGTTQYTTSSGHSDRTEFFIFSSEVQNGSWAGNIPGGGYGNLTTTTTKLVVDYFRYYAPTTYIFWTGTSSGLWTNSANWLSNFTVGATSDVIFSQIGRGNPSTTLGQDFSVHSVSIWESSGISINGNMLTINSGGIDMDSADHDATINSGVNVGAAQTWTVGPGRTLNINGSVSGSGTLSKGGYGTVIFDNSNAFTGTLSVDTGSGTANDGALRLTRSDNVAQAASPILIQNNNGANSTLQLDGLTANIGISQAIQVACRNVAVPCIQNLAGNNILQGDINTIQGGGNVYLQADAGSLTLNGALRYIGSLVGGRTNNFQGAANIIVNGQILNSTNGSIINVAKSGSGTLTLSNVNTYTGSTRIMAGKLRLGHPNALQSSLLDLNVADSGSLDFGTLTNATFGALTGLRNLALSNAPGAPVTLSVGNNNQSCDFAAAFAGPGNLVKIGSGAFTLSGTNIYSGNTTVNAGTLRLGQNTNLTASKMPIVRFTFDGIGAGGVITNYGTGGAALNGVTNGSPGATIVGGGRYGNALNLNGDGSYIRIPSRVTSFDGNTAGVSWTLALWLKTSQAGAGYAYQGDGSWVSGNTAFYLNQGNTSSGTQPGAVRWGGGWLTGNAALNNNAWHFLAITVNNGVKAIYVDGNFDSAFPATTWPNASTGSQVWIGGTADNGDGVADMVGMIDEAYIFGRSLSQSEIQAIMNNQPVVCANCFPGQLPATTPVAVSAGATLDLNGISQSVASLSDSIGGGIVTNSAATVPVTLTLSNSVAVTNSFGGRISDSGPAGSLNLVVAGNGAQVLNGPNSYHGTTVISGGSLLVNGSIGTNSLTVNGGVLGGTGVIGGAVNVQSGGTLSPGASVAALTINNSLALSGNTLIELDKSVPTNDSVRGLTTVTYGGTLTVTNLNGSLAAGDSFKVFYASSYQGSFNSIVPSAPGTGLAWDASTLSADGTLRIAIAQPVLNSATVNGGNLIFAGTNGRPGTGYSLLSSTDVTAPLTNWVVVTNGTFDLAGAFSCTNAVDPLASQKFFVVRIP